MQINGLVIFLYFFFAFHFMPFWKYGFEWSVKLLILRGFVAQPPEATAVLLMTRHLEI